MAFGHIVAESSVGRSTGHRPGLFAVSLAPEDISGLAFSRKRQPLAPRPLRADPPGLGSESSTAGRGFVHVLAGGLWTGIDLFMGFVVDPILRAAPFEARRAVITRLTPKTLFMPTLATRRQRSARL